MRPEQIQKARPVVMVIGSNVFKFPEFQHENELRVEVEIKHQEREAEKQIHEMQKTTHQQQDGYYVSCDIVYKVYHGNTQVKKVTGEEARQIKRKIKNYVF